MRHIHLALVTRLQNEASYLGEWLEYHLLVGVEHFFLYDMDSAPDQRELLEPYVRRGLVTRVPWSHFEGTRYDRHRKGLRHTKSSLAIQHFAKNFREQVQWAQMIDGDEFLFPTDSDSVLEPLSAYDPDEVRALSVPRYNFGHNGHESRPPGLMIANYLRREAEWSSRKELGNAVQISTNFWNRRNHRWHYKLFARGRLVTEDEVKGLRINHYYTKSFEEFQARQNTNRTRSGSRSSFDHRNARCNAVEDTGMLRFVEKVEKALEATTQESGPATS